MKNMAAKIQIKNYKINSYGGFSPSTIKFVHVLLDFVVELNDGGLRCGFIVRSHTPFLILCLT